MQPLLIINNVELNGNNHCYVNKTNLLSLEHFKTGQKANKLQYCVKTSLVIQHF